MGLSWARVAGTITWVNSRNASWPPIPSGTTVSPSAASNSAGGRARAWGS